MTQVLIPSISYNIIIAICKVLTLIHSVHPHKPAGPVTFPPKSLFEIVPCSWSHNASGLPISSSCFRHDTMKIV